MDDTMQRIRIAALSEASFVASEIASRVAHGKSEKTERHGATPLTAALGIAEEIVERINALKTEVKAEAKANAELFVASLKARDAITGEGAGDA